MLDLTTLSPNQLRNLEWHILIQFLATRGALISWLDNMLDQRNPELKKAPISTGISGHFSWAYTDEGDAYWRSLSRDWDKVLNNFRMRKWKEN